jgi:hypothetical protein
VQKYWEDDVVKEFASLVNRCEGVPDRETAFDVVHKTNDYPKIRDYLDEEDNQKAKSSGPSARSAAQSLVTRIWRGKGKAD